MKLTYCDRCDVKVPEDGPHTFRFEMRSVVDDKMIIKEYRDFCAECKKVVFDTLGLLIERRHEKQTNG